MRTATLIIGLILTIGLFIQSLIAAAVESIDDSLNDRESEATGGAIGVLVALVFLIASALVIAKPRFSMWAFAAAGVLAIIGGATTIFTDLIVWGIVGLVLAAMAWRGSVEKRKSDAVEQEQRDNLATLARAAETREAEPVG